MNRQSDNFYAEQVLKVIGARVYKPPGSTAKGLLALRGLLARSRVRPGTYVISNGSGLFGQTRMSSSQLVRLLSRVTTLDWLYKALVNSLPVAGQSGTLGSRLSGTAVSGRVYAKTGTMRSVSTLAGYVRGRSKTGAVVVFAILHNGFPGGVSNSRRLQDEMVLAMARYLDQW
jgi:D-alanyl-D-alanine carboxypeptidase/D-alanyl-D-alanine-endopeptidase (penicillin-binding protein 4)